MTSNSTESPLDSGATEATAARVAIDIRRVPGIRRFAADYAYNFASVAPFFSGNPSDPQAWADVIRRSQAHPRRREEMVALLEAQQVGRNAPKAARAAVARLADPRAVAILTGQQAGLFGGPLFTLLKALTALKLAAQVEKEHGVPAVAVFWVDAEDHDWNEVRSCSVLDDALEPRPVSLPARNGETTSVATVQLDGSVVAVLDELERILPPTEFRTALISARRSAYEPGVSMSEAFSRWLDRVLGSRGLVVFDASDEAAKPIAGTVFVRELSSPAETVRIAASAGADLVARGYHAQVQPQDDGVALFHFDRGRCPIRRQNGNFIVGERSYPAAALIQLAAERPALFSPNVLLRPIVQDTLFPTVCYVAGPNEMAYLGQLRGIYERFDLPMPLIVPRASATLLDSAAMRFLQKSQLPLEMLQPQDESALNQLLATQIPAALEEAFSEATAAIDTRMARVIEAMPSLDPTLEGAAKSTLGRMQHDLATLRNKMIQAAKRRDDTLRRQFVRTRALAFPQGHAQERTIGFVSFLNQYGPALVERLDSSLPLTPGIHWAVVI